MDSSDFSEAEYPLQDLEYPRGKITSRTMDLRQRPRKSYKELQQSDDDDEGDDSEGKSESFNDKASKIPKSVEDKAEDTMLTENPPGEEAEPNFYEEVTGVFRPEVDQILWKKDVIEEDSKKTQYLVKYKDYSYLHCKWIDEAELYANTKNAKNKINRFNKNFEKKLLELDDLDPAVDNKYFDPSYVEVDRIIYATELFPIIHPKKANEIKGKWSEPLMQVVSKLLNYTKNNVHYGVFFMEPVDPDREGLPSYKKMIQTPMDLGTMLNRVYLDYYKNCHQFWVDLGLVFKNCRKFNKDPTIDIRTLCDTLREVAKELYKQWYAQSLEKYEKYTKEYQERGPLQQELPSRPDDHDVIRRQTELEWKTKENELNNIINQFQSYQHQNNLDSHNASSQEFKLQMAQFFHNNPILFNNKFNLEEVTNYTKNLAFEKKAQGGSGGLMNQPQGHGVNGPQKLFPTGNSQMNAGQQMPVQKDNRMMTNKPTGPPSGNGLSKPEMLESTKPDLNPNFNQDMMKPSEKKESEQKYENILSQGEIELFNPGPYHFEWLRDEKAEISVEEELLLYFKEEEIKDIDLTKEVDRLFLVKWKNLSYLDSTWEHESIIASPPKINDFRYFNRAPNKEERSTILNQVTRHKTYLDILNNPKKRAKCSNAYLNELRNRLYHYDIGYNKKPFQYQPNNQPIYKGRKLLRSYQLESLNWLIHAYYESRNVILADEMGLGKTIQSMAFLNHLATFEGVRGPFLVIAPLSTLEHWKRTAEEWTNMNSILYYDGSSIEGRASCRAYEWFYIDISTKGSILQTAELYKFQVVITSFEVFLQDLNNVFINIPIQFIVVDEAHRLKNQNAKILTSLKRLPCKRILLLTGTPVQNNTEELWSLLNYIEGDKFYSLQAFMAEFGDLSNVDQLEKLHRVLRPYLLRRRKEEVESSIPPLQETIIDIEMTTLQKTIYKALYDKNKSLLTKGILSNFNTSLNNLEMQLRKACNHPFLIKELEVELTKECKTFEERQQKMIESSGKMILLDKLLPKMRNEGKKVLIFSQFTQMLLLLEDYLRFRGYKFEKIDGGIKAKERQNSIDRFNDPTKKRDVFLLSTKAGGLGINLTSANVVVIYDSDWNPQNDVQATARAHRIGQQFEVQCYRLVTAKTYEAKMFERASKKLGLDQAIFMGGDFKTTNADDKGKDSEKKMNKQEMETLLKKGILGFINDDNQESQQFVERDIDDILEKNTHIAKYSLINGTYSFSKSSFMSEKTGENFNLNDPDFWEKVLKNTESQTTSLQNSLNNNREILTNYEERLAFFLKLNDSVAQLIEQKLNITGYNGEDEKNLIEILTKISTMKTFSKGIRDLANQWLNEISRPNRRFKKIPEPELRHIAVSGQITTATSAREGRATRNKDAGMKKEDSDGERIFGGDDDEDGVEAQDELPLFEDDDVDEDPSKRKMSNKSKEEFLRKLCVYCERSKCTIFCQGFCKRSFHQLCKDKIEEGAIGGLEDNDLNFDINELSMDEEKLKRTMNLTYICLDCQKKYAVCFQCKKKGYFYPEMQGKSKKKFEFPPNSDNEAMEEEKTKNEVDEKIEEEEEEGSEKDNEKDKEKENEKETPNEETKAKPELKMAKTMENVLTKCSTANCNKFYHLECIKDNKLFKYFDSNKNKKFRCSLHYCARCGISGDTMAIAQCIRCPKSYHLKCHPKDKITKLTKKTDDNHVVEVKKNDKKKKGEETESPSSIPKKGKRGDRLRVQNNSNAKDTTIKLQKVDNLSDEYDMKIKKKAAPNDKNDSKKKVETYTRERSSSRRQRGEEVPISELKLTVSGRTRKRVELSHEPEPKKPLKKATAPAVKEEKLTYESLGIESPENFDYENYQDDWCRYCGARYSSNFTKGPWNPRTLCTIHYIEWHKNKSLELSPYPELPKRPINTSANTELSYLQKMKSKTDREFLLDNYKSSKRTKKSGSEVNLAGSNDKNSENPDTSDGKKEEMEEEKLDV